MFGNVKEYKVIEITKKIIQNKKWSLEEFDNKDIELIEDVLNNNGFVFALGKKIEKKKARKEEKGDEYTINYNMLPYKIIEENGKYLLVGEAYYPTYITVPVTQVKTNAQGGTYTTTTYKREFDGYFYTHYFVMEFDKNGKMGWSNSAPLEVLKSWVPRRHLSINKKAQALEVFYPSFGHMNHVSYSYGGEELLKEEVTYVEDDVKLKRYSGLDTEYWYDNTFLSSGLLKIKDDDGKNRIFSINRIKCDR